MTRLPLPFLTLLSLAVVSISGCVLPEAEPASPASDQDPSAEPEATDGAEPIAPASQEPAPADPAPEPNMTGSVTSDDSNVGLCLGPGLSYVYCATRSVYIEGTIDNVSTLPVSLESFAGTISVTTIEGNAWDLRASIRSGGMSESQARANLESIDFDWSYVAEDGFALVATAAATNNNIGARHEASLFLTLPVAVMPSLDASVGAGRVLVDSLAGGSLAIGVPSGSIYVNDAVAESADLDVGSGSIYITNLTTDSLVAASGSGSIHADEVTADETALHASAGSVYGTVRGVNATMGSSSGSVYASFVPTASGTLTIDGGASRLDLSVPEGDAYGYDVDASTGSGSVELFLEDGETVTEERHATFLTSDYAERDIQTVVRMSTGSGSIVVYAIEA